MGHAGQGRHHLVENEADGVDSSEAVVHFGLVDLVSGVKGVCMALDLAFQSFFGVAGGTLGQNSRSESVKLIRVTYGALKRFHQFQIHQIEIGQSWRAIDADGHQLFGLGNHMLDLRCVTG